MTQKRIMSGLFVLIVVVAIAHGQPVFAWGPEGHFIIAKIAEDSLTPGDKAKAREYLSGAPLYTTALFADEVRSVQRQSCPPHETTAQWHFVDIPYDEKNNKDAHYDEARDCPSGDCVIQAIERAKAKIRDGNASSYERADALKFLVHFVGDVHQPFHTIDRRDQKGKSDQGGNAVNVTFFGEPWTLHALWDDGLILKTGRTAEDYAVYLEREVVPKLSKSEFTSVDPVAWANAAHELAKAAYVDDCSVLDEPYYQQSIDVVDQQLALAGVHLAAELTEVLKDPQVTAFRACPASLPLITGCPQKCPPPSQCKFPQLLRGGTREDQLIPRQSLDYRTDRESQ
jgi:hypothetical protein